MKLTHPFFVLLLVGCGGGGNNSTSPASDQPAPVVPPDPQPVAPQPVPVEPAPVEPCVTGSDLAGNCRNGTLGALEVAWSHETPALVLGFTIYAGAVDDIAQMARVAQAVDYRVTLDPATLGFVPGAQFCVRVTAFNAEAESGPSAPACIIL